MRLGNQLKLSVTVGGGDDGGEVWKNSILILTVCCAVNGQYMMIFYDPRTEATGDRKKNSAR